MIDDGEGDLQALARVAAGGGVIDDVEGDFKALACVAIM